MATCGDAVWSPGHRRGDQHDHRRVVRAEKAQRLLGRASWSTRPDAGARLDVEALTGAGRAQGRGAQTDDKPDHREQRVDDEELPAGGRQQGLCGLHSAGHYPDDRAAGSGAAGPVQTLTSWRWRTSCSAATSPRSSRHRHRPRHEHFNNAQLDSDASHRHQTVAQSIIAGRDSPPPPWARTRRRCWSRPGAWSPPSANDGVLCPPIAGQVVADSTGKPVTLKALPGPS